MLRVARLRIGEVGALAHALGASEEATPAPAAIPVFIARRPRVPD
jgi:hypothetical protein